MIDTDRLILRRWRDADRKPFAAMNADPEVMRYFPSTLTADQSNLMVDRIEAGFETAGWGLFAVEVKGAQAFIGFVGLMEINPKVPCAPGVEIGWRLDKAAWGHGYASEAARACLDLAFTTVGLAQVLSFTAVPNLSSQAVMQRIGMIREPTLDFDHPLVPEGDRLRSHVVYRARRPV